MRVKPAIVMATGDSIPIISGSCKLTWSALQRAIPINRTDTNEATAIAGSDSPLVQAKNTPTRIVTMMNEITIVGL